jgi:hypothetical protein
VKIKKTCQKYNEQQAKVIFFRFLDGKVALIYLRFAFET